MGIMTETVFILPFDLGMYLTLVPLLQEKTKNTVIRITLLIFKQFFLKVPLYLGALFTQYFRALLLLQLKCNLVYFES